MYDEGLIRYWDDVFEALKIFIQVEGGSVNPDGTFNFPASFSEAEKTWAKYVRDYQPSEIEANLVNASSNFGQNQWLDAEYFGSNYLQRLQGKNHNISSVDPKIVIRLD